MLIKLIVWDFNIHIDNTNDALGLAFTDLINSFGVKQNVTGPTHRFNHTLDLIQIKSNQIKSLLLSQHMCLGEWNSWERAPDSAETINI